MASLSPERAVALAQRHQARSIATVRRADTVVARLWQAGSPIDDALLARFVDLAAPQVAALRNVAEAEARSYLSLYLRQAGLEPVAADIPTSYRPLDELLTQPTIATRWALGQGRSREEALRIGAGRLSELVATEAGAAQQYVEHSIVSGTPGVIGWRRVPDSDPCPLCVAAATQRYRTSQLRARHEHCHCGVAPITGTLDPGRVIEQMTRQQAAAAGIDVAEAIANTTVVDDPIVGRRLISR